METSTTEQLDLTANFYKFASRVNKLKSGLIIN